MKEKPALEIQLTSQQIASSLSRVTVGVGKYLAIQKKFDQLSNKSLRDNADFKKSFNGSTGFDKSQLHGTLRFTISLTSHVKIRRVIESYSRLCITEPLD